MSLTSCSKSGTELSNCLRTVNTGRAVSVFSGIVFHKYIEPGTWNLYLCQGKFLFAFPLSFFLSFILFSFLSSPQSTTHHDVPSEGAKVLCPQREASEPACANGNKEGDVLPISAV